MICRQNIDLAIESSLRMRSCQNAELLSAVKFRSILSIQLTTLIRSSGTFYYNLAVKWDPSVQKKTKTKKVSRDYDKAAQEYRASIKVLYQLLVCGIGDDLTSGPSLYYVSKRTGWVGLENHFLKMTSFADVHYCIYADKVGEWVQKGQKYADVI